MKMSKDSFGGSRAGMASQRCAPRHAGERREVGWGEGAGARFLAYVVRGAPGLFAAAGYAVLLGVGSAQAAPIVEPPEGWGEHPDYSYHYWEFGNDDNPAAPDAAQNPFVAAAEVTITVGKTGAGWMDPEAGTNQTYGDPDHGAWDMMGEGASLSAQIPVADTLPIDPFDVELQISVIAWKMDLLAYSLPELNAEGYSFTQYTQSDEYIEDHTDYDDWGEWYLRTWTGRVSGVDEESVTLNFSGEGGDSPMVIDVVETHLIPEPHTGGLLVLGLAFLFNVLRRRRVA